MPALLDTSALRRYLKKELQGKHYTNADTGNVIGIFASGIEASLKNRNTQARRLYAILPELLKSAVFVRYDPNAKRSEKPGTVGYETYYAATSIDGKTHSVRIVVDRMEDDSRGRGYYYHQIRDIDLSGPVGKSRSQSSASQTNYPEPLKPELSLGQIVEDNKLGASK